MIPFPARPILAAPILAAPILAAPILAGLLLTGLAIGPASAQEPLFLRIRPTETSPRDVGSGGAGPSEAEIARAARAAREAVWERSTVRARLAIASVCTGCLKPLPARPERASEDAPAPSPFATAARATDPSTTQGAP